MTTYSYTLVLNDSESIMLEEALKLMIQHCNDQMGGKPKAPFYAWKVCAERVQARLHDNAVQTSGNNFAQD